MFFSMSSLLRDTLRRDLRARRRAIPAPLRIAAAEALSQRLLSLPFAPSSGHVAGYWAMDGEIALHVWQLRLPRDCTYCLPVLHEDGRLRFAPWRPGEALVSNRHGIPEPDLPASALLPAEAMAFVVAPLVGFDANGHRLGMGGGWYDRSFAFRRTQAAPPWLVGAAFAAQQVESVMPEHWDMPLDALCSEREALLFSLPPEA
jgi:5-formyltetrahydrofolate cyclo-ligase